MTRIPAPEAMTRRIADRAVQYARQDVTGRGWKAGNSLSPMSQEGLAGIKTSARYLMFQEKGIKPFLMKWVENRTLPLGCPAGDGPHFRRGSHVGEPGFVDIPHRGKVWRAQKWRHPGIKPQLFMRNALQKAISEDKTNTHADIMSVLKGEYHK